MSLRPIRLSREDFPDQADWIDKLLRGINGFSAQVSSFSASVPALRLGEARIVPPAPAWHEVGGSGEPAFESSWVNYSSDYDSAAFRMEPGGLVRLKGTVKNGTTNAAIFTLPAGYRPSKIRRFVSQSNALHAAIEVDSAGVVRQQNATSSADLYLDGISFYATSPAAPATWAAADQIGVQHGFGRCVAAVPVACSMVDETPSEAVPLPVIDWDDLGDGTLRIRACFGLQPARTYNIKLLLVGG